MMSQEHDDSEYPLIEDFIWSPEDEVFYQRKDEIFDFLRGNFPKRNADNFGRDFDSNYELIKYLSDKNGDPHFSKFIEEFIGAYCDWERHETIMKSRMSSTKIKSLYSHVTYLNKNKSSISHDMELIIDNNILYGDGKTVISEDIVGTFFDCCDLFERSIEFYLAETRERFETLRVSEAAKLAIIFWEEQTGKKFSISLKAPFQEVDDPTNLDAVRQSNRSKTSREYGSPGPKFVQGLFKILDPTIKFANIDTGLRKIFKKKKQNKPKNPRKNVL